MIRIFIGFIFLFITSVIYGQGVKAITFNIRYDNPSDGNNRWEYRRSTVVDFIDYEKPDFLGLQEAMHHQIQAIEAGIKGYKWIGVGRDDGAQKGEYSPLFYRTDQWELVDGSTFWLSKTPQKPSKDWDAALPRICTWAKFQSTTEERIIYVFNTHYDHLGQEARVQSTRLILSVIDSLSGFKNTILMGDFNADASSEVITPILNSELVDSFASSEVTFGQEGTFNGFDTTVIPIRRIDYVFHSTELIPKSYSTDSRLIDGRFLSDHYPIIVNF